MFRLVYKYKAVDYYTSTMKHWIIFPWPSFHGSNIWIFFYHFTQPIWLASFCLFGFILFCFYQRHSLLDGWYVQRLLFIFCFVPLVYMPLIVPVTYCYYYCVSVIYHEAWNGNPPSIVPFVHACSVCPWSFVVPYKLRKLFGLVWFLFLVKNVLGMLRMSNWTCKLLFIECSISH